MVSTAPALDGGLRILELIVARREIGFSQLKLALDIPAASLNRYLKVLMERGYVEKSEQSQYVIGAGLRNLSIENSADALAPIVAPLLKQICEATGHTAIWFDWLNGRMRCRDKEVAPEGVVMQSIGESRTDYAVQPWGYLFLGTLAPKRRKLLLASGTLGAYPGRIPDEAEVERAIIRASELGYSDDAGKLYMNNRRIAVPVAYHGQIRAAIAVGMAGVDYPQEQIQSIVRVLKEKALMACQYAEQDDMRGCS
jgi:DNA-binding IclR family transcriptional regulator